MDASPPPPASANPPPTLDYHHPDAALAPADRYVSMLTLVGATLCFATAHWITEYVCQCIYCFHDVQPFTPADVRATQRFEHNMFLETAIILACSLPFLIIQGLYRPDAAAPVRPHAWLAATLAGVAFCLSRWFISFAFRGTLPESIDFCIALLLTAILAAAVSRYRWPRQPDA